MSEWFQSLTHEATLERIEERLNQDVSAVDIIEEMMPRTREDALSWACRLAYWDEYGRHYSAQVIALARIVSRRTMREFSLALRSDGRVVEKPPEPIPWKTPPPALTFQLELTGEPVRVQYTRGYFPDGVTDMLYFVSPHQPPQPHALSATGYWSHLISSDVVDACGGPQAYAMLLADAKLRGEEKQLTETFEGTFAKKGPQRRRQVKRPRPTPGGHVERLSAGEEKPQKPPRQGMLF